MALSAAHLFNVAGKKVLVTGGGRGLGEMISRAFVENGATVYISSRSAKTLERKAEELSAAGPGKCFAVPEDLSTQAGCDNLAKKLAEREEHLHVLVNNSGIAWGAPFYEYPTEQFDKVMNLNVKVPFLLTRAFRPMLERGAAKDSPSRIINIGSIVGLIAQPIPTYAYDASKAALHSLTKKLAPELAPKITVNAIAPGFVPSRMSRGILTGKFATEEGIAASNPMGRWGADSDIGGTALFLSSKAANWITGQIISVDGGQSAQPLRFSGDEQQLSKEEGKGE